MDPNSPNNNDTIPPIIEYVSIILENNEGKLWVSRRNNPDKIMYGKYQCPGGHIENESRYNALIRELHEETSLTPNETLKFEFEYSFNVQSSRKVTPDFVLCNETHDRPYLYPVFYFYKCFPHSFTT